MLRGVEDSLEGRLLAVTGAPTSSDTFRDIEWIAPVENTNFFDFSKKVEGLHGEGRYATLPHRDELAPWLETNGGALIHLSLRQYEHGFVGAVPQDRQHNVVLFAEEIYECRGMKDGLPDAGYPQPLQNLSVNGFTVHVTPSQVSGDLYATYVTTATKTISPTGNKEDTATLSYAVVTPIFSPREIGADMVTELVLDIGMRSLKGQVSFALKSNDPTYAVTLKRNSTTFVFDRSGALERATRTGYGDEWGKTLVLDEVRAKLAFDVCFNGDGRPPRLDALTTIPKVMAPFNPLYIGRTRGSFKSIWDWLAYKAPVQERSQDVVLQHSSS